MGDEPVAWVFLLVKSLTFSDCGLLASVMIKPRQVSTAVTLGQVLSNIHPSYIMEVQ